MLTNVQPHVPWPATIRVQIQRAARAHHVPETPSIRTKVCQCEPHYVEWYAARCWRIITIPQGGFPFRSRCTRAAKVGNYCTQHANIEAKRQKEQQP